VVSPRYQQLAISHQQSPSAFSASSACPELVEWAVKIYNPIKPETYRTTRSSVQICVISGYKEHTTKSQTLRPSVVQNLQPHQTRSQPHNPIIGANQCYRWFRLHYLTPRQVKTKSHLTRPGSVFAHDGYAETRGLATLSAIHNP
jgi:hypothetical protein